LSKNALKASDFVPSSNCPSCATVAARFTEFGRFDRTDRYE
jgi:hypothetical protein